MKSNRNAHTPLSVAIIHKAALELIDQHGIKALSMRSLATALGVDPMAMYHHIPNKAGLIVGLYNTVLAELIPTTVSPESWRDGLKTLARQYRNLALRHPKLFPSLIASNDNTANAHHAFERLYGLMLESGLSLEKVVHASEAFFALITGFALIEIHDASPTPDQSTLESFAQMAQRDYPNITRLMPVMSNADAAARFEFGLELFMSGLEQMLERDSTRGHEVDE